MCLDLGDDHVDSLMHLVKRSRKMKIVGFTLFDFGAVGFTISVNLFIRDAPVDKLDLFRILLIQLSHKRCPWTHLTGSTRVVC